MKRKSSLQLQALESFYKDEKYPTQTKMESYAAALGLTLKQVNGWFVEKRRRDRRENGIILPIRPINFDRGISSARKNPGGQDLLVFKRSKKGAVLHSRYKSISLLHENRIGKKKKKMLLPWNLLSPQYILKKVFRKDGPPLRVKFDALPSQAFFHWKGNVILFLVLID